MGKKTNDNFYTTILAIIKKIDFNSMSNASKMNLLCSLITAIVIVALSITPVLSLVENIIISVGNICVNLFTDKSINPVQSTSRNSDLVAMLFVLFAEMSVCKIYCANAKKN